MSKSAKAKVDDLLARVSHQLGEQMIHKIHAAMEAIVYGAEMVSTTKRSNFQVGLNRGSHAPTIWIDADRQKAIAPVVRKIQQVTPVKCKLFIK